MTRAVTLNLCLSSSFYGLLEIGESLTAIYGTVNNPRENWEMSVNERRVGRLIYATCLLIKIEFITAIVASRLAGIAAATEVHLRTHRGTMFIHNNSNAHAGKVFFFCLMHFATMC